MTVRYYVKRPPEFEAVQFCGKVNKQECINFIVSKGGDVVQPTFYYTAVHFTFNGTNFSARENDYIVYNTSKKAFNVYPADNFVIRYESIDDAEFSEEGS